MLTLETKPLVHWEVFRLGKPMEGWAIKEVERLREQLRTNTYVAADGGIHWKMGNFVPPTVFRDACCVCPAKHETAYQKDVTKSLAAYRKRMKNHKPSGEELFEMRAAFGKGTSVVNVFTGQRTRL